MSEPRRYESAPKRGDQRSKAMSTSIAAREAFLCLNAGTKAKFRGWGDTKTAARDRAARDAEVTPAQAERLWKNWKTMKSVNGDVYRLLKNKYWSLVEANNEAAAAYRAERLELKAERNAADHKRALASVGTNRARL